MFTKSTFIRDDSSAGQPDDHASSRGPASEPFSSEPLSSENHIGTGTVGVDPFEHRLQQAQAGDRQAQAELLEEHRAWLRQLARQSLSPRLNRRQDASDFVQECLLTAGLHLHQFRGQDTGTFRGWLRTIQRNLMWRFARSQLPRLEVEREWPSQSGLGPALAQTQTSVPGLVSRQEMTVWLVRAIEALDDEDRLLVQLKYFSTSARDPTYEELATRLDCKPAALRQRGCRVLKKLELGLRLLPALEIVPMSQIARQVVAWRKLRGWTLARIAQELNHTETAARKLVEEAEACLAKTYPGL